MYRIFKIFGVSDLKVFYLIYQNYKNFIINKIINLGTLKTYLFNTNKSYYLLFKMLFSVSLKNMFYHYQIKKKIAVDKSVLKIF